MQKRRHGCSCIFDYSNGHKICFIDVSFSFMFLQILANDTKISSLLGLFIWSWLYTELALIDSNFKTISWTKFLSLKSFKPIILSMKAKARVCLSDLLSSPVFLPFFNDMHRCKMFFRSERRLLSVWSKQWPEKT